MLFSRPKHQALVQINSVRFNLLCVWILFYDASSRSCFRFFYYFLFELKTLLPRHLSVIYLYVCTPLLTL